MSDDAQKPAAAPAAPAFADAVRVPLNFKQGKYSADRLDAILAVAEPLLGRKPTDPHAIIRQQPENFFVTMSHDQTIRYPKMHRLEGRQRYRWVGREDGVQLGYLNKEDE